jgi:hypothetical protein
MAALESEAQRLRSEMEVVLERVRRSFRAELVPYRGGELVRTRDLKTL